jgi:hypothetical protein
VVGFGNTGVAVVFGNETNATLVPPDHIDFDSTVKDYKCPGCGGGTNYDNAVGEAITLVEQVKTVDSNVNGIYIFFITDGEGGGVSIEQIDRLAELKTSAYTYAIGNNVKCSSDLHELSKRTGVTKCQEIKDPTELKADLLDIISDRTLNGIELTLNGTVVNGTSTDKTIDPDVGLTWDNTPAKLLIPQGTLQTQSLVPSDQVQELCCVAYSRSEFTSCCVNVTVQ